MDREIKEKDPLVRFQVEVKKSYLEQLKLLQEIGGATSGKELLNNAIALLRWAVQQKQQGYSIVAATPAGEVKREVVLPFLEEAAKQGHLRLVSTSYDSQMNQDEPTSPTRKARGARKAFAAG